MVIIVPAFAKGEEGEEPIVLAGVRRLITDRAEEVRERIDGKGVVPEENGAEAEAPDEERPSADEQEDDGKRDRGNDVVFVQPAQFGILREVADVVQARLVVLIGDNPANVGPEEAKEGRRVQI